MVPTNQQTDRKLSLMHFKHLRDLIYEKSGIFFPENKLYLLEGRLRTRLNQLEMRTFAQYVSHVNNLETQAEELKKIYNLVTINETFFFRYHKQLDAFKRSLLPTLIKQRKQEKLTQINIWSAAASSGEELYTVAMILRESLGSEVNEWRLSLKGTDISKDILSKAELGVYGDNSFRSETDIIMRSKYFSKNGTKYEVKSDLKEMVNYEFLNLNDTAAILSQRKLDFIFCRNVLIYFDKEMKKRVIKAFYEILNHGGYLLLGESESLHGISSAFQVEHYPGAFVYRKE